MTRIFFTKLSPHDAINGVDRQGCQVQYHLPAFSRSTRAAGTHALRSVPHPQPGAAAPRDRIHILAPEREALHTVEDALIAAQQKAEALFAAVTGTGLIRAGLLESELSEQIHALAQERFGVRRHWHKRVVRSGENTVLTYHDDPPDRRIGADDVVYLDFGPLFGEWEADFGRTYVLGADPRKHQLVSDIGAAFRRGKQRYLDEPELSAGSLYDFVCELAIEAGWEFGAATAGDLLGHFRHEKNVAGRV
jgi:Xaa-Pro dipeptidase